ncbi:MAG: twin-arginine translocation signal domain-containing protein [Acidobacteria bacterium]|nr:twin-arginine translocation signal domain-containing protein [Acidobacteriota bacterium]
MAKKSEQTSPEKTSEDRRSFLKMAAGSAAALVAGAQALRAQNTAPVEMAMASAAAETDVSEAAESMITEHPGSDFMVDVLKSLDFDYIASNPGSSFRSLQESFINHGKNKNPEWLTCMHEESSVAMAHGYFKIEGKPMMVMAHGTVGLQHAAMAIYNAFCDRVPVYIVLGNHMDATERRPGAEWSHSVQDAAAMVRDYTKWDDMPASLGHFAESAVRAYKIAMTPPMEPVILVADGELQEHPIEPGAGLRIPRLTIPAAPTGDSGSVQEVARLLVAAEYPVILGGLLGRTQNSIDRLVELAEALQCPVSGGGFPSRHPLSGGNLRNADVILALEVPDLWGAVNSMTDQLERTTQSNLKAGAKVLTIAATDLFSRSNYQDFQRFQEVDLAIAADAEATLPSLLEAVKRLTTADRKNFFADRGKKIAAGAQAADERARRDAALEWDLSPISSSRISYELWNVIKDKDWSLVNGGGGGRLWNFTKAYQRIGGAGGAGVGYGAPASVGAALANRKYGRLSVSIQNDGDLMYAPGVFWTATHHRIPLLAIMNNNRAYHQEVMHLQRMACRHNRDLTTAAIGNVITDPNIDYAMLAKSMGWYAEGPITDPKDVGPALKRAIAQVEKGTPALLDTVMQPR